MRQAGRAATERTPRGPESPAWRGLVNRRGAQMDLSALPTRDTWLLVPLWSLQHARQAWVRRGCGEHLGSLLPLWPRVRLV